MNKSSHFFFFTILLVVGLLFSVNAQDITKNPNAPSEPFGQLQYESTDAVTITHSLSQTIIPANSVSCNAGGLHADNSYYRAFDLSSFGITDDFDITLVEIAIETAAGTGGSQPITCNLYTSTPAFPGGFPGSLTLIGTVDVTVTDQTETILPIPITATAPAGSELVVEIFTPDGQTDGHSFFIGSNNLGETGPSYLLAVDCGITVPTPTATIGFPDMHIVMNVTGDVGGSGGTTFTDDFEAYTVGVQLACQNSTDWTTWSSLPCDPVEDPFISDNYAYSGSNSVVLIQNNDLVKPLGTQTTGKWDIGFMMYIPTGKWGYFNTLTVTPQTGTTEWGMQVYFEASGAARMDAGGANSALWTYAYDTWQACRVVVDLDLDLAEFWFDGVLIQSWQWTLGTFGNGALLQLDGNNFFGATVDDEMYVDDYMFGEFPFVPVELTSFTANVNNSGQVELNWSTATETNNQLFEIERRAENGQFSTIGYVEGHGTTTEPQNYSYTDVSVSTGIYYYRLKQLDFLGSYEYFDEIEVDVNGPLSFDLEQNYPNPFNPSTNIKFSVPESGDVRLAVYNLVGEEVAVLVDGFSEAGFFEVTFNASSLPSGAYFYKLQSGNSVVAKKMLLMK
ncbi:MAG: hypothetical protein DRQ13_05715 [Ignavibacteriae bacterium]|nr:MAG: hypothetical protein DRQ13_05715 [Ignavibacteriota bacterium]